MAHYQYEGLHFELPDGLSNEDAIKKIEAHLGKSPKSAAIPGQESEAARVAALKAQPGPTLGDKALGVGEAALSTLTGLGAGIQAPVAGLLKSALGMVPDAEQETARLMEQQTYKPRTSVGQDYAENVGKFVNDVLAPLGPGNLTGLAQSRPMGRIPKAQEPVIAPEGFKAAPEKIGTPESKQGFDPYVKKAAEAAADDATVARLEAAVAKQNPVKPPMAVTPEGQAFELTPGVEAGRAAADQLATEVAQLKQVLEQNNRSIQEGLQPLLDARKYEQVQQALRDRKAALEQEVAKQTSLDQNAALRAKLEEAPTGHAEWVARQRASAEKRLPGDNTPLDFTNPYPVDTQQFPQTLADAPYQPDNTIPFDQPMLDASLPVEVRDALGDTTSPDPFNRYSPNQAARRILIEGEKPPIIKSQPGGLRRRQGGGVDPDLLTLGIPKLMGKLFSKEKEPIASYLGRLPGLSKQADQFITRPKASAELLDAVKQEPDGPSLHTNLQSGLTMAAKKTTSTMLSNMAQWFDWSQNRANYLVREAVVPLETRLAHLRKDLTSLHSTFVEEMFAGTQYTPEQLAAKGMSQKSIDAYKALRSAYDMFYNEQNKARELLGKQPITKQEAYMASVFRGDYHVPIYDKKGKLRFYIQTQSKNQAKAAINWLKQTYSTHPEFDVSTLKYDHQAMFAPGRKFGAVPRDVMSAWKDIADAMGDDPVAAHIKQAMEQWVVDKGEHAFRQDLHHVREKVNVRGFEGDQPWLSADKSAHNWATAQIEYLKDAAKWSATQEAISNVKTFLTNPEIMQNQPNNVSLAKAYMYNHMGLTENLAKRLEDGLAGSLGLSKSVVNDVGALVRTGVYFKTLVASPGYIVATPIQAIWASLGHFDMAKSQGLVKSDYPKFLRNMFEAMADERAGAPLSTFNKEALKWAEDNGIIQNIVYEDNKSIGSNVLADGAQWMLDKSIGIPDRFARRSVFIPFATALWESGKFATKAEAFRAAGEITDSVAVSMRPQDRPLAVQKLGQLGAMAYQFHSPIVNMYNNLSTFAHFGKRTGNWIPLAKSLLAMGAVGGVFSLPLVNEMEKGTQLIKDAVAKFMPNKYKDIKDFDPRLSLLKALPELNVFGHTGGEWLSYGAASALTGTDLRGRFSNEIINAEDPVGSIFPSTSVYGDMISSAAKAVMNPNAVTGTQLLKDVAPGGLARGMLETNNDRFKAPIQPYAKEGIISFRKPSDISDPSIQVNRTPEEVRARSLGVTALTEATRREKDALAMKEDMRLKAARKGVFDSMFKAIVNKTGDEDTVKKAVRNYLALEGNPQDIERQLERKFADLPFTRQQQQMLKAKRYEQIMSVVRRMEMDK